MATVFAPLEGVRVVDVTSSLAGPYCTEILGALGADVVKVEHPERGDEARAWGEPFFEGSSVMFYAANLNKRSLALDLKRGGDVLLRLVDSADVFLQSLRPGTSARLGFGAAELRARKPDLVYCSIDAFGTQGPWAGLPGYDPLMQAAGGIVSVTGEPGRPGVRVGASVVDQTTGIWAALAILAALYERTATGSGKVVELALYETAVALVPYHLLGYLAEGAVPRGEGTAFPLIVPYQSFRARDGELMIAAANDRLFAALCRALGVPELADDARFRTNPERVRHRSELVAILAERLARDDVSAWLETLADAGVPAAPVHDIAQVAEHEQTAALGLLQPLPHPEVPELVEVAFPVNLDGERVTHRRPPPGLGEHSAEVLSEAGYSEEEVDELAAAGVVRIGHGPAR